MVPPTRRYSLIQKYWLVNMGFSKEKAEQLWNSWCEIPDKPPMPADGLETKEMWDFCTKELDTDEKEPSGDSDEEWSRSLDAYGINQDLKDAIMDPGNLDNLDQPRTTGASDFSSSPGCFYFIHQLKLAELHARYAKRRAGGASVAILCVFVSFQEYWRLKASGKALSLSGLDWLRFVWECRKGLSSSPSGLFDKYGKATLLYGNIPLYREYRRTRIKNETTSDVIRKLTWSHGGIERGRQCMFSASAGERFLREHAKFRILAYQDL
ncbi:hypothetical protein RB213_000791 [Colletotrichum asianum]